MSEQQLEPSSSVEAKQAWLSATTSNKGLPFVILDENDRIGAAWRKRWIRCVCCRPLQRVAGYAVSGIALGVSDQGRDRRLSGSICPRVRAPVRTGVKVDRLAKSGDRFEVTCGQHTLFAENVVVATGAFNNPRVPSFAQLDEHRPTPLEGVRNPSQIQKGAVLVVGAGNSGAEIAMELAPHHQTWLSGPDTGQGPPGPELVSITCSRP